MSRSSGCIAAGSSAALITLAHLISTYPCGIVAEVAHWAREGKGRRAERSGSQREQKLKEKKGEKEGKQTQTDAISDPTFMQRLQQKESV